MYCQRRGGRLAKIGSAAVQTTLDGLLQSSPNITTMKGVDRFWIGASNRLFIWPNDDETPVEAGYKAWAMDGQPVVPIDTKFQCVEMNGAEPNYWWRMRRCAAVNTSMAFICSSDAPDWARVRPTALPGPPPTPWVVASSEF